MLYYIKDKHIKYIQFCNYYLLLNYLLKMSAIKKNMKGGFKTTPIHANPTHSSSMSKTSTTIAKPTQKGGSKDKKLQKKRLSKSSQKGGSKKKTMMRSTSSTTTSTKTAFCPSCKTKKVNIVIPEMKTAKNGRKMIKGTCEKCGGKVNAFV